MPAVGQLVYSRAGRDCGRALVVVAVCGGPYVLVSDGDLRPGARPKRKNVRHLDLVPAVHPGWTAGQPPSDAELRRWIAAVTARAADGGAEEAKA